jgi:hypothetical protein
MLLLSRLTLALSRVHPLAYLLTFLIAIPAFASLYSIVAPQGFYAPYERYEPRAVSDLRQLDSILEGVLRRSLEAGTGQELALGNWKLDLTSLHVGEVYSADGRKLSFRLSFSAGDVEKPGGTRQARWSIIVTVPEHPDHTIVSDSNVVTTYRIPEVDFAKYASPFKEQYEELFKRVFSQRELASTPALALSGPEELSLQRFLLGVRGDPSTVNASLTRMIYLSAVVITTLGFGDILPVTSEARILVATEAITGIVFAGLFLNALAYHAIASLGYKRGEHAEAGHDRRRRLIF